MLLDSQNIVVLLVKTCATLFNKEYSMTRVLAFLCVLCVSAASALAAPVNLIQNGDFAAGNTGFASPLEHVLPSNNDDQYYVIDNPQSWYFQFKSFGDHTTGTGLMFVGNGSVEGGIAYTSNTFDMVAGTAYDMGGWVTSLGCTTCVVDYGNSLLDMALTLGGVDYLFASGATDNAAAGVWNLLSISNWIAPTSGTASMVIRTRPGMWSGNDFALDDLYVRATEAPVPEPASMFLLGVGLVGLARRVRRA